MRMAALCLTLLVTVNLSATGQAVDNPLVLDVWPAKAPGETGQLGEEKLTGDKGSRRLTNISRPTLTVFRPAKDKDAGAAVLIAPGGGYNLARPANAITVAEIISAVDEAVDATQCGDRESVV